MQGAIHAVDRELGRLLDYLERIGPGDNTLVIATTDHGIAMPRAKATLYDPGIEAALIMRLPARGWSDGRTISSMTSNVDLFPTMVDLAGLQVDERVHGRSLRPLRSSAVTVP